MNWGWGETYQHHITIHYFSFDNSEVAIPFLHLYQHTIVQCYDTLQRHHRREKVIKMTLLIDLLTAK